MSYSQKNKKKIKILKGLKRVTYLPPYPPQKLTATNTDSGMVKITWARPKGEFEKYILKVTFSSLSYYRYDPMFFYIFLQVALLEARKLSTMKSSLSPMRQAASFKVGNTNKVNKQTNKINKY